MSSPFLERILKSLLGSSRARDTPVKLNSADLERLCDTAEKVLSSDPMLLRVPEPICVIGDLHGQYYDLLEFLKIGGHPPATKYLFLGNYVNRGKNNVECIALLLALKVKYPESVFLLRGNHETVELSRQYGFFAECAARYNRAFGTGSRVYSSSFHLLVLLAGKSSACMAGYQRSCAIFGSSRR